VLFQNEINLRYCASGWFYHINTVSIFDVCRTVHLNIQGDQKVSVHLMSTIQSSGEQRLFWSPCISIVKPTRSTISQSYLFWNNTVLFQNKINLRYCVSGWFYYRNTISINFPSEGHDLNFLETVAVVCFQCMLCRLVLRYVMMYHIITSCDDAAQ